MGKNGFLERQQRERQAYFDAGLQMGRQQILDMMCIVLNDPCVMRKDTFGKRRLLKVINAIGKNIDLYEKAWQKDDEADYYQTKLDAKLAKIYGEGMHDTFNTRYEYCKKCDYKTGRWNKCD
jgi:hypothetical protein